MAIKDNSTKWADCLAPDMDTMEAIAHQTYAVLPEHFRTLTRGVAIHIAETPDEDIADDLGLDSPFDILGIFEGHSASGHWTPASKNRGNRITLFRRAILDYWCENPETLHDIISHVLINELGHHFGLTELQIADIENELD